MPYMLSRCLYRTNFSVFTTRRRASTSRFQIAGVRCLLSGRVVQFGIVSTVMTASAKSVAVLIDYFPSVVDAFFANSADHARTRAARSIELFQFNTDQLCL